MRFPQTFIDDLRRQADIVRVINDYVTLKKKGANWMACCPFHQEKTPSFSVNPAKDIFYCFGCSKGGSVFNFVMEIERVSFPEAIRIVAEKVGVALPAQEEDKRYEARRKEADEVIELNAWALEWWEQQLTEGNADARLAREYIEGRQVTEETCKAFHLGFAPNSWDALGNFLKSKGASVAQIERSGLVVKKDAGGFYDRFRARLIFPVLDAQGRPIAFGGRAIRAGDEPKYLNSPETAAYTKGRHLYGLHLTRDEIRKKKFVILVEGYLDLIIPYQFGIRNLVASLGTALTPEQVKLLGRFARKVVVNYDGDKAGIQAAKRAIETLLAEDFEVKVLVLPDNADPDEFIKQQGVEEYNRRRGEAFPHIQFVLDQALRDRNLRSPAGKAEAVEEVLPFVRVVRNRIQKREYFDMVLDALQIDSTSRPDLWKSVNVSNRGVTAINVKQVVMRGESGPPTESERRLLALLIHDTELRRAFLPLVEEADYADLPTAIIFRAIKEIEETGAELSFDSLTERTIDDPLMADFAVRLWMGEPQRAEGEAPDDITAASECFLAVLKIIRADQLLKRLNNEMKLAQSRGDEEQLTQLVMENWEWTQYRNSLKAFLDSVSVSDSFAF